MPKVPTERMEEGVNPQGLFSLEELKKHASFSVPTFIACVNRKVNTGNFENIDVLSGITIPIFALPQENPEAFLEAVKDAAELAFKIASGETGERYGTIKEFQSG